MIKSCDEALRTITSIDMIMAAKYTQLKLILMLRHERFGCDLNYVMVASAPDICRAIRDLD